jgi:uncharacterized protein YbjT (DUF2867 family)
VKGTDDDPASVQRAPILLTGATGCVGGRLLHRFEAEAIPVRCLVRRTALFQRERAATTQIVAGDDFEARDRHAARVFGEVAAAAGVRRIVYLGGLGDEADELSRICAAVTRSAGSCAHPAFRSSSSVRRSSSDRVRFRSR